MVSPELIEYIKKAKAAGQTDEQIKSALLSIGWAQKDINEGFNPSEVPVVNYSENSSGKTQSQNTIILIIFGFFVLIFLGGMLWGIFSASIKSLIMGQGIEKKSDVMVPPQVLDDIKPEDIPAPADNPTDKATEEKNAPTDSEKTFLLLPNTFSDEKLGFSINYSDDWKYNRKGNEESIVFQPSQPGGEIMVFMGKHDVSGLSANEKLYVYLLMSSMVSSAPGAKKYDQKGFTYNLDNGETLVGEQWKNEIESKDHRAYKYWFVFLPYKDSSFMFAYGGQSDQYETNLPKAISMIDSWKIMKK
jgi:hypothetical protein